jgi:hypothetical protein
MHSLRRGARAVVVAGLLLMLAPAGANAADITVATTDDTSASECTLRDAITSANGNSDSGFCVASGTYGADSIQITATGNINLATALPDISSDMEIEGPGESNLTVRRNAASAFRVFNVTSNSSNLRIQDLKVENGRLTGNNEKGAGVLYSGTGTLLLIDVDVASNSVLQPSAASSQTARGGGVANTGGGTLTVINSTVEGNAAQTTTTGGDNNSPVSSIAGGGGIFNASAGTLTVYGTTVAGNFSTATADFFAEADGAGVESWGPTTVTASTISGNTATATGGVGHVITNGGGLNIVFSPLNMYRSTVSGNTMSGGLGRGGGISNTNSAGDATIVSSTIASNTANYTGANIEFNSSPQTITLENTIVSDPLGGANNCQTNPSNTLNSAGHNLADDSFEAAQCDFDDATDVAGDPMLAALADNGGATKTRLPSTGGAGVDKGTPAAGLNTDQRGYQRTVDLIGVPQTGDGTDIGAVEIQTAIPSPVAVHFDDVNTGSASAPETVTLTNDTSAPLQIGTVQLAGANPGSFQTSNDNCTGDTLNTSTHRSCTIDVTFAPPGPSGGDRTALLRFPDDAAVTTTDVPLDGTAVDTIAPQTKIRKAIIDSGARKAKFKFFSNEPGTFLCKIDGKSRKRCSSPKTYRNLASGRHRFKVWAKDSAGHIDSSPAVKRFSI